MTHSLALALLATQPALARVGEEMAATSVAHPPEEPLGGLLAGADLPAGEALAILVSLAAAAWRWWHRDLLEEPTDLPGSASISMFSAGQRRARAVARILSVPGPATVGEPVDTGVALARWSAELSEPLLVAFAQDLHAALLRRRVDPDLGPLEGLLRPGAREALRARGNVSAVHEVVAGPAWGVARAADESWCTLDVACTAWVDETWQGERRQRLRADRLRLQRPSTTAEVPLHQVRLALQRAVAPADRGPTRLLPADTGGWVLAQVLESEVLPPTPSALRSIEARRASPPPPPPVDPQATWDALEARHPGRGTRELPARVLRWAQEAAQARSTGQVSQELEAALAGPAAALPGWWRRTCALRGAGPAEDHGERSVGEVEVRLAGHDLDAAHERVALCLRAPLDDADPALASHEERWLLGLPLHPPDADWQVLDLPTR